MKVYFSMFVCAAGLLSGSLMLNAQVSTEPAPETEPAPTVVCHEGQTTFIDSKDLQAHLDHGDTQGACPSVSGALEGSSGDSENEDGEKPEKVTICHKGKNTLNIAEPALQAHLDHGDTQGACPESRKKNKNPSTLKDNGDDDDDNDDAQEGNGQSKTKKDKDKKEKGKGKS